VAAVHCTALHCCRPFSRGWVAGLTKLMVTTRTRSNVCPSSGGGDQMRITGFMHRVDCIVCGTRIERMARCVRACERVSVRALLTAHS
jgi:hypothetical protein